MYIQKDASYSDTQTVVSQLSDRNVGVQKRSSSKKLFIEIWDEDNQDKPIGFTMSYNTQPIASTRKALHTQWVIRKNDFYLFVKKDSNGGRKVLLKSEETNEIRIENMIYENQR